MFLDFLTDYMTEPYLFMGADPSLPEMLLGASPSQLCNCHVDDVLVFKWTEVIDNQAISEARKKQLPYIDLGVNGFYKGIPG